MSGSADSEEGEPFEVSASSTVGTTTGSATELAVAEALGRRPWRTEGEEIVEEQRNLAANELQSLRTREDDLLIMENQRRKDEQRRKEDQRLKDTEEWKRIGRQIREMQQRSDEERRQMISTSCNGPTTDE